MKGGENYNFCALQKTANWKKKSKDNKNKSKDKIEIKGNKINIYKKDH